MKMTINIDSDDISCVIDGYKHGPFQRRAQHMSHYQIWRHALNALKRIGWDVFCPPEYANNGRFRILSNGRRNGMRGFSNCTLQFKTEIYPVGFKFEFFQNHVHENKCGGQYDFNRFEKMPYLLKKATLLTVGQIRDAILSQHNAEIVNHDVKMGSTESILHHFRTQSFFKNKIKDLSEMPQHMSEYDFNSNSTDRDGKNITCGQTKYTYGPNGVLQRGTVYHNINNMWWFVWNESHYTNVASFELFDLAPEDLAIRRKKRPRIPKEYEARRKAVDELSTKELRRELRRRAA